MSDTTPATVIAIASAGRPALLGAVIANLAGQTAPFIGMVSVPDDTSLPPADVVGDWTVVTGSKGLSVQRNAALETADAVGAEFVFFFDDDAVVREDYVRNAVAFFRAHPDVVGITGRVLLDGAVSGEVSEETADAALAESAREPFDGRWHRTRELYGCNFAVRVGASHGLRFDGRLPLYSWLEDHDFARRLMPYGTLAHVEDCVIVHRAASSGGRQAHTRLGYSQMMNPLYMWRKGSFPAWLAFREIFRPTAKNIAMSIVGPSSEWRRERLRGNLLAVGDATRGKFTPERAADL